MKNTMTTPQTQSPLADQLAFALRDVDSIAHASLRRIASLARLARGAMQNPGASRLLEDICETLRVIQHEAESLTDGIGDIVEGTQVKSTLQ